MPHVYKELSKWRFAARGYIDKIGKLLIYTYIVAAFAWLELLVGDVHLLGTKRAGVVSIVAHGSTDG